MYGTSGNFLLVKMWLLVSIHFAWHQVTILEEEREGGGGGLGPHGPSPGSATAEGSKLSVLMEPCGVGACNNYLWATG